MSEFSVFFNAAALKQNNKDEAGLDYHGGGPIVGETNVRVTLGQVVALYITNMYIAATTFIVQANRNNPRKEL